MTEPVLRRATTADLATIDAIQSASPEAAHWPPEDYLRYQTTVAVDPANGRVLGFLAARRTAPAEHELLNLAVLPTARRAGIGTRLFHAALTEAGPSDWFLEVRRSNQSAIAFYRKHGFQLAGIRPSYYANPKEDAVVMRRSS